MVRGPTGGAFSCLIRKASSRIYGVSRPRVSLRACLIWQVLDWQQRTIEHARQTGHTRTLMGRYRELPGIGGRTPALRAHAERAAINTPIQGGAADVMTLAMLKLDRSEKLKELGFKMLLQASDRTQMGQP